MSLPVPGRNLDFCWKIRRHRNTKSRLASTTGVVEGQPLWVQRALLDLRPSTLIPLACPGTHPTRFVILPAGSCGLSRLEPPNNTLFFLSSSKTLYFAISLLFVTYLSYQIHSTNTIHFLSCLLLPQLTFFTPANSEPAFKTTPDTLLS